MTETPTVERETLDELAEALAKFQGEMPTVTKSKTAKVKTNTGADYSYTYADLADVTEACAPILAKHGLAFSCQPGRDGLVGMLLHASGQRLTGILPITGVTPQQVGSSLTYGRRYLFGCLTGVVTDDDDDGRVAEPQRRKAPERRPPVAPPPPDRLATEEHPAPDGSVDVPLPEPEPEAPWHQGSPLFKALHAGLAETLPAGTDRDERLAIVAAMVERPIESTSDLTKPEAIRILGIVERIKAGVAGIEHVDGSWQVLAYGAPS